MDEAGGAIWLGLYGDEGESGVSCIKFSSVLFGADTENSAEGGVRSVFLNVSDGRHPVLLGNTSVTKLCTGNSNICKQFESTLYCYYFRNSMLRGFV